jgi:hypothetical protein
VWVTTRVTVDTSLPTDIRASMAAFWKISKALDARDEPLLAYVVEKLENWRSEKIAEAELPQEARSFFAPELIRRSRSQIRQMLVVPRIEREPTPLASALRFFEPHRKPRFSTESTESSHSTRGNQPADWKLALPRPCALR